MLQGCLAGAGDEHGGGDHQQFVNGRSLQQLERSCACWRSRRSWRPGQRGRGSRSNSQVLLGSVEEDRAELRVLGILATSGLRGPRDQGPGEEKQRPGLEARRSTSDLGRGRSSDDPGSLLSAPPGRGIVEAWARGGVTGGGRRAIDGGRLDLGRAILNLGRYRFKIWEGQYCLFACFHLVGNILQRLTFVDGGNNLCVSLFSSLFKQQQQQLQESL